MKHLLIICALLSSMAHADMALTPYLPPEATVKEALLNSPLMHEARAKKDSWSAKAKSIEAGTAEFTVRSSAQRRRELSTGSDLFESMLSIERPLRIWGKRGLDISLAEQTQAFAEIEYADAMHEGSRELLKLWFSYLRALIDQKNATITFDLAAKVQRLTQSQLKQGEVSRLNAELASAEVESASAARSVVNAQLASAASAFARRYPSLALPTTWITMSMDLVPQSPLEDSLQNIHQLFLEKNHELNMLRIDAQRLSLAADRVSRDRVPDPTLGVFAARDRGGAEQVVGLMFSMPLSGAARSHHASAAFADAQAARERVVLSEQQLGATFESLLKQYSHKRLAAESLQSAANRQALAAEKSLKAYTLGEGNLSDALSIARLASNNLNAAERMQLEVVELLALIRLDLHQIWDFDE